LGVKISLLDKNSFVVECDDMDLLLSMQSVMGGDKLRNQNKIRIPLKASILISKFDRYGISCDSSTKTIIDQLVEKNKKRVINIQRIKNQYSEKDIKFDYNYRGLYPDVMAHQKIMFNAIYYSDAASIIADPGTCKTGPYLWAIDKRIEKGVVKRALVITLSDLKKNVLAEMEVQVPHLEGVVLNGSEQANKILNRKFNSKKRNKEYHIYISNYESMFALEEYISEGFFEMIVLDEAHRLGSPKSRQTKSIIRLFENSPYKYIVTGTLHANNTMSFYMPFRFLGADTVPYANYDEFRRRYMYAVDPDQYVWIASPGAHEEIKKITGDLSVMFKKEDCLDLPPLIRQKYTCKMHGGQEKLYKEMSADLVAVIDDMCGKCNKQGCCDNSCEGQIGAKTALTLQGKLHQIASGFYINTRYEMDQLTGSEKNISNTIILDENPKMNLLIDTLINIPSDRKIIIWTNYTMAIQLIVKAIDKAFGKGSCLTCYGDDDAFGKVRLWESAKQLYMVANPRKMGVGQNIQYSNYQVFFSNSRSWVTRDQAEGRQHRKGQKETVTVIDLVTENTIDEIALMSLMQKQDLALTLSELSRVLKNKGAMEKIILKRGISQI